MGAARQAKRPKRSEVKRVQKANPSPLGVGADSELDRGVEFRRIEFCDCIQRCQDGGLIPA